jgi:hypothetical protein
MHTGTSAEQSSGDDARIVQDEQFVSAKETGKLRKEPVLECSRIAVQMEKTGSFTALQWTLCDLPRRKVVIELVEPH